jgi:SAM-dependent methyltransferase
LWLNVAIDRPKNKRKTPTAQPIQRSSGVMEIVTRYLAEVGYTAPLEEADFDDFLVHRFGELGRAYLDLQGGEPTKVFAAKAASLDLALAVESHKMRYQREEYFSWITTLDLSPPNRVVDVGCGIGVVACFFARYFPEAEVLGIDRCQASIACAKQLAAKLGAENVRFEQADALALPEHLASQQFDLVISNSVAGTIDDRLHETGRSIEDVRSEPKSPGLAAYASTLSGLMADRTGTLITFERIQRAPKLARWVDALHDAGIRIDWQRSGMLLFPERLGFPLCDVPVLVGCKGRCDKIDPNKIRGTLRLRGAVEGNKVHSRGCGDRGRNVGNASWSRDQAGAVLLLPCRR